MRKRIKGLLNAVGYGCEIRKLDRPGGLRMTHIRRFPSEGRFAKFARKLERIIGG